jgi:hypothetical protein
VARPKDRSIDVNGPGDDDDAPAAPPSHRAARLLALAALVLIVGSYAVLNSCQRQSPDRSVAAFCAQVGSVASLDDALGNLDANGAQEAFTVLTQLEQVAPNDIDSQVRTVIEAVRPLVETLQTASSDQEQALRQVLMARQGDASRVDGAAHDIETYTSANCHRDLDTAIPDTVAPTALSTSTTAFAPPRPTTSTERKAVPPPASSSTSAPTTTGRLAPTTTASTTRSGSTGGR